MYLIKIDCIQVPIPEAPFMVSARAASTDVIMVLLRQLTGAINLCGLFLLGWMEAENTCLDLVIWNPGSAFDLDSWVNYTSLHCILSCFVRGANTKQVILKNAQHNEFDRNRWLDVAHRFPSRKRLKCSRLGLLLRVSSYYCCRQLTGAIAIIFESWAVFVRVDGGERTPVSIS